jgi:hypothetical protein
LVRRKTGIKWLDRLSNEEFEEAMKNLEMFRASLTPEERKERFNSSMQIIREIRAQEPQLTANLSDAAIGTSFVNSFDLDEMKRQMIEIFEKYKHFEDAADLRKRRLLVDTWNIELIDNEKDKETENDKEEEEDRT